MAEVDVPYAALLVEAMASGQPVASFLRQALEDAWYAAYIAASARTAEKSFLPLKDPITVTPPKTDK